MNKHGKQMHETKERIQKLREAAPKIMDAFGQMHSTAYAPLICSNKTQALVGIGIATAIRCVGCINHHVSQAIEYGASREEVIDAIQMAILMGGGPSVHYGAEVLEAFDEFTQD